jgi:acyl carrier protein
MSDEGEISAAVIEIVTIQLGRRQVARTDRLIEDLGAESADLVNLAAAIDDRFGVFIGEEVLADLKTVADLEALVQRETGVEKYQDSKD